VKQALLMTGVFLHAACALHADYDEEVRADGPVAYYRFEESEITSIVDSSGNGYDSLAISNEVFRVPGLVGNAGAFSNSGAELSLSLSPTNGSFSIEALVRFETTGGGGYFVSQQDGTGKGRGLLYRTSGGSIRTYLTGGGLSATVPVTTGTWHHVVLTVEADVIGTNDARRFYIDGVFAGADTNRAVEHADGNWVLGASKGFAKRLHGSLDEVAIYDSLLSSNRVAVHYHALFLNVDITNANRTVEWTTTTASVGGTNTPSAVGTMSWTNSATEDGGEWQVAGGEWQVESIPLAYGTNLITVTGTNVLGTTASDSVEIVRGAAPPLVVDITNVNHTVSWPTTAASIGGTNTPSVVGTMSWANGATGDGGAWQVAGVAWQVESIPLAYGTNVITVTGTNVLGTHASDSVEVVRSAAPPLVVDITNANHAVDWTITAASIGGTSTPSVVGTMAWTNAANGASDTFAAASPWTVEDIPLAYGTNVITVTGTNALGTSASDSVEIVRTTMPSLLAGFGTALEFDGTDDIVNLGTNDALNLGNTLTIEAWVKPADLSARHGIFSARRHNTSGAMQLEVGRANNGSGRVAVGIPGIWVVQTVDGVIGANEWTHIAYTRSGVGATHTIYVNGVAQTLVTNSDHAFTGNASPKLIGSGTNGGQLFAGDMDEVRLWKVPLSANVITNWMYRQVDATHPASSNLVAYYQFNEGSGSRAGDEAGGNDGTLSGMTASAWPLSTVREWTVEGGETFTGRLVGSRSDGSSSNGYDWTLGFEIVQQATLGTVTVVTDNVFQYTASTNPGQDSFSYRVRDAADDVSNIHTVSVEVVATPWVSITNANDTVNGEVKTYSIGGTNNAWVVGTMIWSNAATGDSGSFSAASPWTVAGIPLAIGANVITVSGSNVVGDTASDS